MSETASNKTVSPQDAGGSTASEAMPPASPHNQQITERGTKMIPAGNAIITTIDKVVNWGRAGSLWPMTFGLA